MLGLIRLTVGFLGFYAGMTFFDLRARPVDRQRHLRRRRGRDVGRPAVPGRDGAADPADDLRRVHRRLRGDRRRLRGRLAVGLALGASAVIAVVAAIVFGIVDLNPDDTRPGLEVIVAAIGPALLFASARPLRATDARGVDLRRGPRRLRRLVRRVRGDPAPSGPPNRTGDCTATATPRPSRPGGGTLLRVAQPRTRGRRRRAGASSGREALLQGFLVTARLATAIARVGDRVRPRRHRRRRAAPGTRDSGLGASPRGSSRLARIDALGRSTGSSAPREREIPRARSSS